MARHILFAVLFVTFLSSYSVEAFTVVLKNGKVMTGTLISETAEGIVFKDDKGVQFSLKKSSLDLGKMQEANAMKAPEPTMEEGDITPKKKGKVYTKEDLEALKAKYGDLTTSERPIIQVEDYEAGVLKPEAYHRYLTESGSQISQALESLTTLANGVATAWEIADSTGKDANEAIRNYMSDQSTSSLAGTSNTQVAGLEELRDKLSGGPQEYGGAYDTLAKAIETIKNFQRLVQDRSSVDNSSLYRSRLQEMSSEVSNAIAKLENLPVQEPKKAKKAPTVKAPAEAPSMPEGETGEQPESEETPAETPEEPIEEAPPEQ